MSVASRSALGLFFSSLFLLAIALQTEAAEPESQHDERDSAGSSPDSQQFKALVAKLDHRLFDEREAATMALQQAGMAAVPHLTAALEGKSFEAADRSVGILQQFARSDDRPLQLAALSSLVEAREFARSRRQAEQELTRLHERMCTEAFAQWGAKLEVCHHCPTAAGRQTRVVLTIHPEKWTGNRESFRTLHSLRRLDILKIDAPMVDDQIAHELAGIKSLRTLELINTQASIDLVDQLRCQQSLLTVRIRSRTYLGVTFWQSGSLEVMRIDPASPARQAGIEPGDFVTSLAGVPLETFETLTAHLAQRQPGDEVEIGLIRGGESLTVVAKLAAKDWSTE